MKSMQQLVVSIATGFVLAGAVSSVDAKTLPYKGSASGTFVNTEIDSNMDGQKASLIRLEAKSSQGRVILEGVSELIFSGAGVCPNGNDGFLFTSLAGTASFVNTFPQTGDQLWGEFTSTVCFDPVTSIQFFSSPFEITGGTGKYEGATGDGTAEGTARNVFEDADGNFFGQLTETFEATIILP